MNENDVFVTQFLEEVAVTEDDLIHQGVSTSTSTYNTDKDGDND